MTTIATTTLPDTDDMLRRLTAVDNDPHMVEKFYPHLLKKAGQEQAGMGLVLALQLAVADYTQGMPPFVAATVMMRLPAFVRALTDDPQVQADALAVLAELGIA